MAEEVKLVPPMVKCADCGFLSRRFAGVVDSPYFEVTRVERDTGTRVDATDRVGLARKPYCFRRELPVTEFLEMTANKSHEHELNQAFVEIINKDRKCGSHCLWQEGDSPQEHSKMVIEIELAKIKAQSEREALARTQDQFERQLAHQVSESEKARLWQDGQNKLRVDEQKERDEDQQKKQVMRDETLAGIQHDKQVERDDRLARKQGANNLWQAVITAGLAAVVGGVGFFGGRQFAPPSQTTSTVETPSSATPPTSAPTK